MTFPGIDTGAERPVDPRLAKALSHPLRQRILEHLSSVGEASPTELARALDERLTNVAYHVRVLLELGTVELVRTRRVRGALEHHYRAIARPWLDLPQWSELAAPLRRQPNAETLRDIIAAPPRPP
jgi:DNA-binding transcriptional ArsR family regulator